jgi:uncharacterized RDD family membrane protein YckC
MHAQHQKGSGQKSPKPDVHQALHAGRIEHHGPEIGDLRPGFQPFSDDVKSGRGLLPGIGHHDPDGAEHGTQKNPQGGDEVDAWRNAVPAEQEHPEKAAFQGKGKNAFGRQGRAKHVSHVTGIHRPVGPELKLHDDARGHAQPEGERENARPETRHPIVVRVGGAEVEHLHQHHQQAQADAERRIDVMEGNGKGKLNPGEDFNVHGKEPFRPMQAEGKNGGTERTGCRCRSRHQVQQASSAANQRLTAKVSASKPSDGDHGRTSPKPIVHNPIFSQPAPSPEHPMERYHNILDAHEKAQDAYQPDYASFWERFGAIVIDGIVVAIPGYLFLFLAFAGMDFEDPNSLDQGMNWGFMGIGYAILILGSILYPVFMEASKYRATLGKMALKLQVNNATGGRISLGQAFGRNLGKIISGMILYIGYLMVLWDGQNQSLHDKMASTWVVRRRD